MRKNAKDLPGKKVPWKPIDWEPGSRWPHCFTFLTQSCGWVGALDGWLDGCLDGWLGGWLRRILWQVSLPAYRQPDDISHKRRRTAGVRRITLVIFLIKRQPVVYLCTWLTWRLGRAGAKGGVALGWLDGQKTQTRPRALMSISYFTHVRSAA